MANIQTVDSRSDEPIQEPNWWALCNVHASFWWRKHGGREGWTRQRCVYARCHELWEQLTADEQREALRSMRADEWLAEALPAAHKLAEAAGGGGDE